jgi:cytochrome c-type biogenesis protein CcmE
MSKLDDELAAAIQASGDEGDAPGVAKPVAKPRAPATQPAGSRSLGLLIALLAMVGGVVALFMVGFKEAAIYALTVDKLVEGKATYGTRPVRVEGELVPGTLVKRDSPCEYRFTVHGEKERLPIRYARCTIPDGFRDVPQGGVMVTVEGSLSAQGDFEATMVMAKCASKYDEKTHTMKDDKAAGALPMN